jgi:prepilin-type N-terminal cleavage/methylation domain-containing protein
MKGNKQSGFTLVELSIVLVIIGFLVAGVTAGTKMIESSKVSKIGSDVGKYAQAVGNFRSTYNALPGDFRNASSYWSEDACLDGSTMSMFFCGGNGNGIVERDPISRGGRFFFPPESLKTFRHLQLAKFVNESYQMKANDAEVATCPTHMPGSPFTGGCYWMTSFDGSEEGIIGLTVGSYNAGASEPDYHDGGALSASVANAIDKKFDDGNAQTGKVFAQRDQTRAADTTLCFDDTTGDWLFGNTDDKACNVNFYLAK